MTPTLEKTWALPKLSLELPVEQLVRTSCSRLQGELLLVGQWNGQRAEAWPHGVQLFHALLLLLRWRFQPLTGESHQALRAMNLLRVANTMTWSLSGSGQPHYGILRRVARSLGYVPALALAVTSGNHLR